MRRLIALLAAAAVLAVASPAAASAPAKGSRHRFAITSAILVTDGMPRVCPDGPCPPDPAVAYLTVSFDVPSACWRSPKVRVVSSSASGRVVVAATAARRGTGCPAQVQRMDAQVPVTGKVAVVVDARTGAVVPVDRITAV